ncbi:glycosyltransferase family 2 protein [Gymnodinialimonas ulvae]|uniref:glycosyltransferase family 2 protein n=1 Tax=Gymnodinialimonas ulvae TaxID=3126504 RepID=UPI0030A19E4F
MCRGGGAGVEVLGVEQPRGHPEDRGDDGRDGHGVTPSALSVVVVSTGRPEALHRCLLALSQLRRAGCEVVVVADRAGRHAVQDFAGRIKLLPQDIPNISAARNAGIASSSGQIVAFIDDDAVPEPTWGDAIVQAFTQPGIAAVTGPVLGRNGIGLQWGPQAVNGQVDEVETEPATPFRDGFVRKLHGTNMAFRRAVFDQIGGFDEAMHFYLDDTDMALRIGHAGLPTAWIEAAIVHHGFQASVRRTADRVPTSLHDIGSSTRVFLRKHAGEADHARAVRRLEAAQSSRLLRLAKTKALDAEKMRALMESLRAGLDEGRDRESLAPRITACGDRFQPFCASDPPKPLVLSGRPFQRMRLHRVAADAVGAGQPVTLFIFEPTPRKHRVRFTDGGWWEHSGGLFGPADRTESRIQLHSFRGRVSREVCRISAMRGL